MPKQSWFVIVVGGYIEKETRKQTLLSHVYHKIPYRPATRTRPAIPTQFGPLIATFRNGAEASAKIALYEERRKQGLPIEPEPQDIAFTKFCKQKNAEWEDRWQDSSLWKSRSDNSPFNEPSPLQKKLLTGVADLEFYLTYDDINEAFWRVDNILEELLDALSEACNKHTKQWIEKALEEYWEVDYDEDEEAWRDVIEEMCDLVSVATDDAEETEIGEVLIERYEALSERYDQWKENKQPTT